MRTGKPWWIAIHDDDDDDGDDDDAAAAAAADDDDDDDDDDSDGDNGECYIELSCRVINDVHESSMRCFSTGCAQDAIFLKLDFTFFTKYFDSFHMNTNLNDISKIHQGIQWNLSNWSFIYKMLDIHANKTSA